MDQSEPCPALSAHLRRKPKRGAVVAGTAIPDADDDLTGRICVT